MTTKPSDGHTSAERLVAEGIVEFLAGLGVPFVFGIPGAKTDPVFNALDGNGPPLVLCRHEQNAAFMAAAVGRLTRLPGVVLTNSGPGASNLVTGLLTATTEGDPIVALVGAVPRADQLKHRQQSMDTVSLFKPPVTKRVGEVSVADNVPEAIMLAFRVAVTPRRERPPSSSRRTFFLTSLRPFSPHLISLRRVRWDHSHDAVGGRARKPDRGGGLQPTGGPLPGHPRRDATSSPEAVRAIRDLVAATRLPLVETFQAAGVVFRELESCYVGRVVLWRNQSGDVLLSKADVILAIGYDPVGYPPSTWNRSGERAIIYLDELISETENHYQPGTELCGDIAPRPSRLCASGCPAYRCPLRLRTRLTGSVSG
nr:thiamine pyrophosphate-binding protein [Protofrankia symbiont of Coriaria ruscifolia]